MRWVLSEASGSANLVKIRNYCNNPEKRKDAGFIWVSRIWSLAFEKTELCLPFSFPLSSLRFFKCQK